VADRRSALREDSTAVKHDDNAEQHDRRTDPIEGIGLLSVHTPAPQERPDQEAPCVGGEERP
jgi:hypothetical protein